MAQPTSEVHLRFCSSRISIHLCWNTGSQWTDPDTKIFPGLHNFMCKLIWAVRLQQRAFLHLTLSPHQNKIKYFLYFFLYISHFSLQPITLSCLCLTPHLSGCFLVVNGETPPSVFAKSPQSPFHYDLGNPYLP